MDVRPVLLKPSSFKVYARADIPAIEALLAETLEKINDDISNEANINVVWDRFEADLRRAVELHVPLKTVKPLNTKHPVWFNSKACKLVTKQRKLYNKYRATDDLAYFDQYKQLRRQNKKVFKKMKSDFYNRTLYEPLKHGNSKPFYSYMKKIRGGRSTNYIKEIENENGDVIRDSKTKANVLNNYFHSVFTEETAQIDDESSLVIDRSYTFKVDKRGVASLLKNLKDNKAAGPDNLKKVDLTLTPIVAEILTSIYSYSIALGELPDKWKENRSYCANF
jgi:hypothetical protein